MRWLRIVRTRYPYTAGAVLYTMAAVTLFAVPATHQAGRYAVIPVAIAVVQLAVRVLEVSVRRLRR